MLNRWAMEHSINDGLVTKRKGNTTWIMEDHKTRGTHDCIL